MGRHRISALLATLSATALLASAATAQTTDMGNGDTITYSGRTLIRIRTGAGGYTAQQRADAVRSRLIPILSLENLTPDDIVVQQERPYQDASILVRGHLLVTVDRGLAQANGNNDPGDLARAWADHLRRILPDVSVKPNPNVESANSAAKAAQ